MGNDSDGVDDSNSEDDGDYDGNGNKRNGNNESGDNGYADNNDVFNDDDDDHCGDDHFGDGDDGGDGGDGGDGDGDDADDDDSIDSDSDGEQSTEIPLYNDSPISSDEFRSIFLALQQKHNFSSAATNSILKLFQVSLPPGNKCPRSSYKFEAELSGLSYSYTKTFTCQQCQHVLDNSLDCSQYEDIGIGENSSVFYIIDLVEEIKVFIIGM